MYNTNELYYEIKNISVTESIHSEHWLRHFVFFVLKQIRTFQACQGESVMEHKYTNYARKIHL
jgi:hypothetical protein